ncbi:hypothetical protein F7731_19790 [Cytobacillus depressus]|uniref:Uncharacterized protein n=2 Tax=Cytobacillus depressus TaxID=1602942 RepID=A0A6L3V0G6_9BACI|nr:hypothetical protein [Cytobacillus depressus]KAB2330518.1 hypothetical protein F7731_19790 [Cytobacillus depressus]
MFAVHFFENKNQLLCQLLKNVPNEGEALTIKGRTGKIASVKNIDEKNIHVQVIFEAVKKAKPVLDNSKKKKR